MTSELEQLDLDVGDASPFVLVLYDDQGQAVNLASGDRVAFQAKEDASASPELELYTGGGGLTFVADTNEVTATLTQSQADALTPGTYLGQASVEFDTAKWRKCKRINVVISAAIAANLP